MVRPSMRCSLRPRAAAAAARAASATATATVTVTKKRSEPPGRGRSAHGDPTHDERSSNRAPASRLAMGGAGEGGRAPASHGSVQVL